MRKTYANTTKKTKSTHSKRRFHSESPEYKRRRKEEKIQIGDQNGSEDILRKELAFSIPAGNKFKLARITGTIKKFLLKLLKVTLIETNQNM